MLEKSKLRPIAILLLVAMLFVGAAGTAIASQIGATKDAAPAPADDQIFYVGDKIQYDMTVFNPQGNPNTNTLQAIWDTLPDGTRIDFLTPPATLVQAPGQSAAFQAEYTVDWDDAVWDDFLDAWVVINTFEATGRDSAGDGVRAWVEKRSLVSQLGSIGDFVWNDMNRNGIQDVGEPGVEGWKVYLWSADDECEPIEELDDTTTDANGYYLFEGLRAGKYLVQFEMPSGEWVFTQQYAGMNDGVDSNADPATGWTDCIDLGPGENDRTIDAGMYMLVEELDVSKTVDTSYIRTHQWDIDKWVETDFGHTIGEAQIPKIWLYSDGSGDENGYWYVDVTYMGYTDSDHEVCGTVTIENTGELDAEITDVSDLLGGTPIDVDFGVEFPYTLEVGDTLEGTYCEDGEFEGYNEVTVTTERDEYSAEEEIVWGDPDAVHLDEINVEDESDLFGTVWLGMLNAADYAVGEGETFSYDKWFEYGDYNSPGPHIYDNTATIVETGQSASAQLRVNWVPDEVCFADETAWAFGGDYAKPNWNYVNNKNWGWTNGPLSEGSYEWPIYAGAGQNILSKGEIVGTLYVDYEDGCVTVKYDLDEGFYLGETHLWVGSTPLPMVKQGKKSVYTNAPGQFPWGHNYYFDPMDQSTWKTDWEWSECGFEGDIYVAAHSVVWMPVECEMVP